MAEPYLDNVVTHIGLCKLALTEALDAGHTPEEVIKVVADAIGLDMRGIPPFFVSQIAQAMVTLTPSSTDAVA